MIGNQMKTHVFSCFDSNIYVGLKQPRIEYTNITTARIFKYLYTEYGEKTLGTAKQGTRRPGGRGGHHQSINYSLSAQAREMRLDKQKPAAGEL